MRAPPVAGGVTDLQKCLNNWSATAIYAAPAAWHSYGAFGVKKKVHALVYSLWLLSLGPRQGDDRDQGKGFFIHVTIERGEVFNFLPRPDALGTKLGWAIGTFRNACVTRSSVRLGSRTSGATEPRGLRIFSLFRAELWRRQPLSYLFGQF